MHDRGLEGGGGQERGGEASAPSAMPPLWIQDGGPVFAAKPQKQTFSAETQRSRNVSPRVEAENC